jgi:chitodextrinase
MPFVRIVIFILYLCVQPLFSSAATSDFNVSQQIGGDTSPPTTPTLLSATPMASTQIDVSWSVATDDFQLEGYVLYRDGLPVATTTLTSFSDTGLTASTTYTYFVRAFDWLFNYSSSSNSLATTTLAPPPVPPPTVAATGTVVSGSGRLTLRGGLDITTDLTSAQFVWNTNRPSRFALRWGTTASYELGFVTTDRYREVHKTVLSELTPGTTYQYELVAMNPANNIEQVLKRGQFTTKSAVSQAMPQNVYGLMAETLGTTVRLRWQNPQLTIPFQVRVVRNHLGYPEDPHDGMVVYQGDGEELLDVAALAAYGTQYYSVYVLDTQGGVSSGAVIRVVRTTEGGVATGDTRTPPVLPTDILLPTLNRSAIQILQHERMATFADEQLVVSADAPFTLRIPKEALPRHLKSIIVTLLDPEDYTRSYAFLLRLNVAGTAYESTLAPMEKVGVSQLLIEVYDFETNVVGRYGKQIELLRTTEVKSEVMFPDTIMRTSWLLPSLLTGTIVLWLLLILFLWRRRQQVA